MKKKISILGFGFIGKNLLNSYLTDDYFVNVFDRKACPPELLGKVNWIQDSFHNSNSLVNIIKDADIVYHLISSTVPADDIDENLELSNNVLDTISLLKLCVREKVKRIIFLSSASVYGIQPILPISELALTDPISTHGIHKLTIEKYIQYYNYKYALECKIIRLSNPYGLGQHLYGRQGFIAICLGKILRGEDIVVMGDGSAIRDFIYIDDVIMACHKVSTLATNDYLFNIGSGVGNTLFDVFNELRYFFGDSFNIVYHTTRKTDIGASVLDISKAKTILGFAPEYNLSTGIRATIEKYAVENPLLATKILNK